MTDGELKQLQKYLDILDSDVHALTQTLGAARRFVRAKYTAVEEANRMAEKDMSLQREVFGKGVYHG